MENYSIWKTIKAGFWLGIGFIVPTIIVYILGTALVYKAVPYFVESNNDAAIIDAENSVDDYVSKYDKTSQVELLSYKNNTSNGQLLILGVVKNTGESPVNSVQVEAELMNSEGEMVYECSEYISSKIPKNQRENFQIKCGCGKNPIPEYKTINVRVVKAAAY